MFDFWNKQVSVDCCLNKCSKLSMRVHECMSPAYLSFHVWNTTQNKMLKRKRDSAGERVIRLAGSMFWRTWKDCWQPHSIQGRTYMNKPGSFKNDLYLEWPTPRGAFNNRRRRIDSPTTNELTRVLASSRAYVLTFWHVIWRLFWCVLWHFFWHMSWRQVLHLFWHLFWQLFRPLLVHLFWHQLQVFWHLFRHINIYVLTHN